jgi:hypothetical protein
VRAVKPGGKAWLQRIVDQAFAECMQNDRRTLAEIRHEIRRQLMLQSVDAEQEGRITDHQLQIMISRNAMGEGEWEYYPAYTSPPRYLSRKRIQQLVDYAEAGRLTQPEAKRLQEMLEDLERGVGHWRAKHARARQKEEELANLARRISNRAFGGHTGVLL